MSERSFYLVVAISIAVIALSCYMMAATKIIENELRWVLGDDHR